LGIFLVVPGLIAQDTATQEPQILPSLAPGSSPQPAPETKPATAASGPTPLWIWGEDENKRYALSIEFDAPAGAKARLMATCDNEVELFLNGKSVGQSSEWQEPLALDASPHLKTGKNILSAQVANQGGPAAFALKMTITPPDGTPVVLVSDGKWTAREIGANGPGKPVRTVGKMGDSPWGDLFSQGGGSTGGLFQLPVGFQIERLFTVPKSSMGSWVCLTVDEKGRLIASDQENKGLYRIIPGKPGTREPTRVEKLKVNMTGAQGLLCAFGALYVCANGGPGSGLYKLTETDGDDQYDRVEKLKELRGGGEHGPHALRLSPDGKKILVVCGNHTLPPEGFQASRIPSNWNEDHLLPRQWDANGHARGILAPGGYIAQTDPEGKTWEILSIGYRNQYDIALNPEGEIFAYDADMEWDMGMPWYRPTRVNHATSGSELGWRSGTGKWPSYYPDSLPAMVDIGPGSPVGVEFGTGARFPAKYQKALYICDWTFGTMYALHLSPQGSSYSATKEEFVSRTPLPLTDVVIGKDGAMYFTVGGRGTQSELFRVTYTGKESVDRVDGREEKGKAERDLRHKLEGLHKTGPVSPEDLETILSHLGHPDRFIRYAARIALEHRPVDSWKSRVASLPHPIAKIHGVIALARQGKSADQSLALSLLAAIPYPELEIPAQLDALRALQLVFIRLGAPSPEIAKEWAARLERGFPTQDDHLNRELVNLLVYLQSPNIAAAVTTLLEKPSRPPTSANMDPLLARNRGYGGSIAQMISNAPDPQKLHYLFAMRNLKNHWTLEQRKVYFTALNEARQRSGGASYQGFLNNIERDAYDNATDTERLAIEALGLRKPAKIATLPKPMGPGKEWSLDAVLALAKEPLKARNFQKGKQAFAAARCVVCHRFDGEGGATGPDLSQAAGRFSLKDLTEAIVDPNKVISDQYKASIIETKQGKVITGKVVSETRDRLIVVTDPEDSTKTLEIAKSDIEEIKSSPVSLMPAKLLDNLNANEVLDLLAYLLSRGDPQSSVFRP